VSSYVSDTHALLWHLADDPALSAAARELFRLADVGQAEIVIPSIVLAELVYLGDRQRVPPEIIDRIIGLPAMPGSHYHIAALDTDVVQAMRRIPRDIVPDMPDRIIAATALHLDLPLISRDRRIVQLTSIQSIW
jgi:PIN domain nuclease of toxin-antitoxin system